MDPPLDPGWDRALGEARRLFSELERLGGRAPGVLAVLSHPPVVEEVSPLNFALLRRSYDAIAALRGRPTHVRMMVAIDRLALNATPWWQEAGYAGAMSGLHLAIDRQPSLRGRLAGRLLARSRPERLPFRVARELAGGGDGLVVLAGGVEATSRVFYTLRAFVVRLRRAARRAPELSGPARANPWRGMELELAALALSRGEGDEAPAFTGRLTDAFRRAAAAAARSSGVPEEAYREMAERFEREFQRATPYRERFFSFLTRRVVPRRPLLLLPVNHGDPSRSVIRIGSPVGLAARGGTIEALTVEGEGLAAGPMKPASFAPRWVAANFD